MMTRKQYMAQHYSIIPAIRRQRHRAYYAQFVCETVKGSVLQTIGLGELLASTDPHLNDIPLRFWDCIQMPMVPAKLREAEDVCGLTAATRICIAKEAARQLIESHNSETL